MNLPSNPSFKHGYRLSAENFREYNKSAIVLWISNGKRRRGLFLDKEEALLLQQNLIQAIKDV